MTRWTRPAGLVLALVGAMVAPGGAAADDEHATLDDILAIREATREFRDVAAAEAAGYGVLVGTPLESCIDEPGAGGMGFHRVHGELVGDTLLDPLAPEALIHVEDAVGELELVGVEYVVFADAWHAEHEEPPVLLGHALHLVDEPNRYELPAFYQLHAWVWRSNPAGLFETWNPTVSCAPSAPLEASPHPG